MVAPRQALIVLGMHRSGTSALAGTLARVGVRAPATLLEATPNNPKGFWESPEIMKLHDQVLDSMGTSWADWSSVDVEPDSQVAQAFARDLEAILEREYGDAKLFLVKDPRTCRLASLWLKTLDELGVAAKVVLATRHPMEVSASLAARNGFSATRAQLIWLRHILDSEAATRRTPRVVIRYEDLLSGWRRMISDIGGKLGLRLPTLSSEASAEIDDFLTPELRHHSGDDIKIGHPQLARWVKDAYAALSALVRDADDQSAQERLDAVRLEFDAVSSLCAPILQEIRSEFARSADSARRRLEAMAKSRAIVQREVHSARQTIDVMSMELERQLARCERIEQECRSREQDVQRQKVLLKSMEERAKSSEMALEREKQRSLAFQRGMEMQAQFATECRTNLEEIRSGRVWRFADAMRRVAGKPKRDHSQPRPELIQLISGSGLFDEAWYLEQYPDVRVSGVNPVEHYLRYGAREGRDPSKAFSTVRYQALFPEVMETGLNPLLHYLRCGYSIGEVLGDVTPMGPSGTLVR